MDAYLSADAKDELSILATEHLLEQSEDRELPSSKSASFHNQVRRQRASLRLQKFLLIINVTLLAFNAVFFICKAISVAQEHSNAVGGLLPLPAQIAEHFELRRFKTMLTNNPFAGTPREELDDAWHGLLKNDNIRVPDTVLKALNLDSVRLVNSSDVLASLGAFHGLHCLKKVRQMTYKEHYHANKTEDAMIRETAHSDHCIEYLREYIMCHPDLSFVTYHWINGTAQHQDEPDRRLPTTWDHALHECASWDAIDAWAGERNVDLWNYEQLELPTDGLHY